MSKLKPLANRKLILNRIAKVQAAPPKKPLRGIGNIRVECPFPHVFRFLEKVAHYHVDTISSREKINRFGKLGFVGHNYVSPELWAVIEADKDAFSALEASFSVIADFGITPYFSTTP